MTAVYVYNGGDSPVAINWEGSFIAGRSWGVVDNEEFLTRFAIDSGWLVLAEEPTDSTQSSPQAWKAHLEVEEIRNKLTVQSAQGEPSIVKS